MKLSKNRIKRIYHSRKGKSVVNKVMEELIESFNNTSEEQSKLNNNKYISDESMKKIVFAKLKDDHPEIGTKIEEEPTNKELKTQLDEMHRMLKRYIKHSTFKMKALVLFYSVWFFASVGLFIYGKIQLETLIDIVYSAMHSLSF